jgi:hypothetical protein
MNLLRIYARLSDVVILSPFRLGVRAFPALRREACARAKADLGDEAAVR